MDALKILQHHQIVHRDIKPENLLMTKASVSSQLKLADFGLAVQIKSGEKLKVGKPEQNHVKSKKKNTGSELFASFPMSLIDVLVV